MTPTVESRRSRPVTLILVILVALGIAGGLTWWLSQPTGESEDEPVLTPEAKAYTSNLQLSGVEMKATDNALGQTLLEITGRISNNGDRPVARAQLRCVFYNPYGQALARERVAIIRKRDGILYPGESRPFRLPFDSPPEGWNQTLPQLVIAEIQFAKGK